MAVTRYLRTTIIGAFRPSCHTSSRITNANRNLPPLFLRKGQHQEYSHTISVSHSNHVSQRKMSGSTENETDTSELANVGLRYQQVLDRVHAAAASNNIGRSNNVRLVAVSKTKPMSLLEAAYTAGCRHFGENYVQEMIEKVEMWHDKTDVQWHFIGALQSNKCQSLVNCCMDITQLTVETISSIKLATKLNNAVGNKLSSSSPPLPVENAALPTHPRLKVFVQVNTSGEDSKSGVEPGAACIELCRYIVTECPFLELRGLMTIGAPGDTSCFTTLAQCREHVHSDLAPPAVASVTETAQQQLELSMGMSDDFERAIEAGSTNVRVGSTIFGHRNYST